MGNYDFIKVLKENNGYWQFQPGARYLAELTSGKVSTVFCNTGVVTTGPVLLQDACEQLLKNCGFKVYNDYGNVTMATDSRDITHVIGPACGGVSLAYEIARILGAKALFTEPSYSLPRQSAHKIIHDVMCGSHSVGVSNTANDNAYEAIKNSVAKTGQKFRFDLPDDAHVLFVEDVLTTGTSTKEMIEAVSKKRDLYPVDHDVLAPKCHPTVLCLVDRKNDTYALKAKIWGDSERGIVEGLFDYTSLASVRAQEWESWEEFVGWRSRLQVMSDPESRNKHEAFDNVEKALRPKQHWEKLTHG